MSVMAVDFCMMPCSMLDTVWCFHIGWCIMVKRF